MKERPVCLFLLLAVCVVGLQLDLDVDLSQPSLLEDCADDGGVVQEKRHVPSKLQFFRIKGGRSARRNFLTDYTTDDEPLTETINPNGNQRLRSKPSFFKKDAKDNGGRDGKHKGKKEEKNKQTKHGKGMNEKHNGDSGKTRHAKRENEATAAKIEGNARDPAKRKPNPSINTDATKPAESPQLVEKEGNSARVEGTARVEGNARDPAKRKPNPSINADTTNPAESPLLVEKEGNSDAIATTVETKPEITEIKNTSIQLDKINSAIPVEIQQLVNKKENSNTIETKSSDTEKKNEPIPLDDTVKTVEEPSTTGITLDPPKNEIIQGETIMSDTNQNEHPNKGQDEKQNDDGLVHHMVVENNVKRVDPDTETDFLAEYSSTGETNEDNKRYFNNNPSSPGISDTAILNKDMEALKRGGAKGSQKPDGNHDAKERPPKNGTPKDEPKESPHSCPNHKKCYCSSEKMDFWSIDSGKRGRSRCDQKMKYVEKDCRFSHKKGFSKRPKESSCNCCYYDNSSEPESCECRCHKKFYRRISPKDDDYYVSSGMNCTFKY